MPSPTNKRKLYSPNKLHKHVLSPAPKTQKLEDGVVTLSSILKEMKDMEKRLQLHAENLFNKLSSELDAVQEKLGQKVTEIEREIKIINERSNDIEDRIASIESDFTNVDSLGKEIKVLRGELAELKSKQRDCTVVDTSSDAVIFGVPVSDSENLKSIFNQVCRSIDFLSPQIRDIFRVRPKNSHLKSNVVIVKFYTPFDRNRTLKVFSDYRRRNKCVVSMRSAGFDIDSTFCIFESLDIFNRKILQLAVKQKRERKFWSVFSTRGKVYVRVQKNSEAIVVPDEESLMKLIET